MARRPTCKELEERIKDLEKERAKHARVEEALRESERRSRAIFDQTYEFVGLLEPDGTVIEANKTALQFAAVKGPDVIGKPFWETPWWAHSPELQSQLRDAIQKAAQGEFIRFEVTHRAPDGSLRYVDFSLKPVLDEKGKVVLIIPEGRDITDRRSTEEALRRSEDTAQALLNGTTDMAMLIDRDGIVLAINRMRARAFGRNTDEIIGRCVFDFFPADVAPVRRMWLLYLIESRNPVHFEDSAEGRFYDHYLYPILDEKGEVTRIATHVRDITDYKMAMVRLEERTNELTDSEVKYRTLVENLPVVVYRMNSKGQLSFVNRFVDEMFGFTSDEILRSPEVLQQGVYPEDRPAVGELRRKSLTEGKEFIAEYRIKHKDGHLVYVIDHAIPVPSQDGSVHSVDGFMMDVTERVKLQKKLVRAEEIKTISEVSARLAHEIRNPLVSVGGFARRLLSSMSPQDPNKTRMEIIVKETERMEAILRMILNYIQPFELNLSPTDPNSLVVAALRALSNETYKSNVKVNLQLAPALPQISVDRERMEDVVKALFRNALNQISADGVLHVSTSREEGMFELSFRYLVEMSPDDVKHFFYPFKWTKAAHQVADLPLTKILVDKHGGTINVRLAQPGELTVQVLLPF